MLLLDDPPQADAAKAATRAFRRPIAATKVTVSSLEAANAVGAAALVFHTLLRSGAQRPPVAARAASLAVVRAGRRRGSRSAS